MVYVNSSSFDTCDFFRTSYQNKALVHDIHNDAFSFVFTTSPFHTYSTNVYSRHPSRLLFKTQNKRSLSAYLSMTRAFSVLCTNVWMVGLKFNPTKESYLERNNVRRKNLPIASVCCTPQHYNGGS